MKILIKNAMTLIREPLGEGDFKLIPKDVYIEENLILKIADPGEGFEFEPEKVIDAAGRILMPGLINAHTHAYMSLFRNSADDLAFWDWLSKVQKVEESNTTEDIYWGTLLNCIEMIQTGTTCFVDMNIKSASEKEGPLSAASGAAKEAGMRAVITRGLAGSLTEEYSRDQLESNLKEMELFKDDDLVETWFGPHAPYSCMADYLEEILKKGKDMNKGQTIHLSESVSEVENSLSEKGMTPIAYVDSLGIFEIPTIAAHCVQATDDDIRIMKEKNVSVALNPKSNMKLGNGFAPAEKMLDAGVNICLGTDGCGSNNSQNMFAEMNTAALIYKGAARKAQCISAQDVLKFATVNGAKAIGHEGELGEIKEGALADVIILDTHTPEFHPANNSVSGLVYSATGREVETVIINGKIVMENRKILTIDEDRVYKECARICDRVGMAE